VFFVLGRASQVLLEKRVAANWSTHHMLSGNVATRWILQTPIFEVIFMMMMMMMMMMIFTFSWCPIGLQMCRTA
jgi:hypothetical protein